MVQYLAGIPGIIVTGMQESDLAEVAALEKTSPSPWSKTQFAEELRQTSGGRHVARGGTSGRLLAYICCRRVIDEAEILKLVVAPDVRRQGLGMRLLSFALNELRQQGTAVCFLEMRASNLAAQALYEKSGFVRVGIRKAYYARPVEDAVVMSRILDKITS